MKKLLVLAALTMAAAPAAMASKARVTALANSRQIVDIQTAFDRPYQFVALGDLATMEWGETNGVTGTTTPHAEGGFLRKSGEYSYGMYLGRRADAFNQGVGAAVQAGRINAAAMREQNPLNLFVASKSGDWTWGTTLKYSNGKDDANTAKSTSAGIALGAAMGAWEFDLAQGLVGKSEYGTQSVESKGSTSIGVDYKFDEAMLAYFKYGMTKADSNNGTNTVSALDAVSMEAGFVNTVAKTEESNFFYGVALNTTKIDKVSDTMTLPVWMGIETNAASWMVLRASVKQNVLINEEKDITGTATDGNKKDVDSVVVNAGLGLVFGKNLIDATFGTANKGHLSFSDGSTDKFMANVAYTYNF